MTFCLDPTWCKTLGGEHSGALPSSFLPAHPREGPEGPVLVVLFWRSHSCPTPQGRGPMGKLAERSRASLSGRRVLFNLERGSCHVGRARRGLRASSVTLGKRLPLSEQRPSICETGVRTMPTSGLAVQTKAQEPKVHNKCWLPRFCVIRGSEGRHSEPPRCIFIHWLIPPYSLGLERLSPKCWLKLRECVCDVSAQCTTGQCSENLGRCYSDFTVPHLHP